jgi:hypothetical protein
MSDPPEVGRIYRLAPNARAFNNPDERTPTLPVCFTGNVTRVRMVDDKAAYADRTRNVTVEAVDRPGATQVVAPQFLLDDTLAVGDTVTIRQPAEYSGGRGSMARSGATRGIVRQLADSDGDLTVECLDGHNVRAWLYVGAEFLTPEATPRKETVTTSFKPGDRLRATGLRSHCSVRDCTHPSGLVDATLVVVVGNRDSTGNYQVRAVNGSNLDRLGIVHESYLTPDANTTPEKEITIMSEARTVIGAEFATALRARKDAINEAFAAQITRDEQAIVKAEQYQARLGGWYTAIGELLVAGDLAADRCGNLSWTDKNRTDATPERPDFEDVDALKAILAGRPQQQERHTAALTRNIELFTLVGPRETTITASQYSEMMTALPTF